MWSLFRKNEKEIRNSPISHCHVQRSTRGFGDHLRSVVREKEEKPKSMYVENGYFYILIILIGFMITSPLPAAIAQSGEDDGGGSEDDGGGSEDDGGGSEDDGGGSEDDNTEVDEEDKQAEVMIEANNVQGLDDTITQDPASLDSIIAARPGDRGTLEADINLRSLVPPVGPDGIVPPVGPDGIVPPVGPDGIVPPVGPDGIVPPVGVDDPQLIDDSESISNIKKEVKKTEEILSLEDEKFVNGIINYAKEHVEKDKDIDEESKLLLTKLTPDETKALVSAQIQFIGYSLTDIRADTTVPSGTVGDTEPPQPIDTETPIPEQLSTSPVTTHDKCENGANSDSADNDGICLPDNASCKKGYIMNDNNNCVKKSFCEHPNDSKCKYKNDNKNGNGKDSDDDNSHDGGGTRGDEAVIQSANANAIVNATVAVNTLNGTYVCSLEGIAAATQQAFDLLKYQTCGTQLNGQKAYYDGFVQQCMQRNSKEICKAATGQSSNMEKQSLQPLQAPQTMQQQAPQTMQQQAPQTMQQQAPQTMQQYVQQESQHQATTQQIMEILNNVPEAQRQGILSKVDQSELPKLIHASFPLAMTVVDVAPGSKVVKEITERPELHAMLNPHEKQVFLSLNTYPTPEKLAEFLDLPPEKLPEFLNMLTEDELSEMFDMLPQDTLTSVLTSLNTNERNEAEHGGKPISSI
jgi:hypothetical protein